MGDTWSSHTRLALELPQEAQIVTVEIPNVVNAVL
jgi:hypothetical protein